MDIRFPISRAPTPLNRPSLLLDWYVTIPRAFILAHNNLPSTDAYDSVSFHGSIDLSLFR